jgi:hypothetical protein
MIAVQSSVRSLICLLLFAALIAGCKTTSTTVETSRQKKTFVVTFFSKGAGIDREAKRAFDELLGSIQKDDEKLKIEKVNWGREGETDYIITQIPAIEATLQTQLQDFVSKYSLVRFSDKAHEGK